MEHLVVDILVVAGILGIILARKLKARSKTFDQTSHDIGMIYAASLAFLGFGIVGILMWILK